MVKLAETLQLYAGLDEKDIADDMKEKIQVLDWMVKNKYEAVDQVGRIVSHYYLNSEDIMEAVRKGQPWDFGGRS